jgi:hypothetical protein
MQRPNLLFAGSRNTLLFAATVACIMLSGGGWGWGQAAARSLFDEEDPPIELEEVTIWGSPDGAAGWGPWASIGDGARFSDAQVAGEPAPDAEVARFSDQTQDARCSQDPEISRSSSRSPEPDRALVAGRMYRAYVAKYGVLRLGSAFPVVYGDGGSETWRVAQSFPSPGGLPVSDPKNLEGPGSFVPPTPSQCAAG